MFKKGHKINFGRKKTNDMSGNRNPNWRGGRPGCLSCGKKLSRRILKTSYCIKCSGITRRGESNPNFGKDIPLEVRKKMSESHKGEKSSLWRGGITPVNAMVRKSLEYKLWRESVFRRDDFTCVGCEKRGGVLNADHIKPFSLYPHLGFVVDNGRTLCFDCHKETETYGVKVRKF